jgi:hypothetical protein
VRTRCGNIGCAIPFPSFGVSVTLHFGEILGISSCSAQQFGIVLFDFRLSIIFSSIFRRGNLWSSDYTFRFVLDAIYGTLVSIGEAFSRRILATYRVLFCWVLVYIVGYHGSIGALGHSQFFFFAWVACVY